MGKSKKLAGMLFKTLFQDNMKKMEHFTAFSGKIFHSTFFFKKTVISNQ